jgi:nucleotide-binding universal stress UspA family protein
MDVEHPIVAAYDATREADDGLALAQVLGRLTDSDLLVVRVMEDMVERDELWPGSQREVRERIGATRRALVAALPASDAELMPVLDPSIARALHDIAHRQSATVIVLGSSHHHGLGRLLLGGAAEAVVNGSPCPVAVAPPGFAGPGATVSRVMAAYDGSATAEAGLGFAAEIATVGSLPLTVVCVRPSRLQRTTASPASHDAATVLEAGVQRAEELVEGRVAVEGLLLVGDPGHRLSEAGGPSALMVMGSHQRGTVRRALLGSVSTHVMRHAHQPVIVVPVPHRRAR